ncbi:MAG TPA: hypothetical protein VHN11_03295, partial [Xanthobacteraceae bacterium]|nr:hypothetical protein [Xanthobacteraceae bacterium]
MSSDIVLSAAVRDNLLSLNNTAKLAGITQGHLATGKKVSTALDNPVNFFTASGLSARAGDLSALLDSISIGVHTLEQASNGITAQTKLVQQAKSIAQQARSSTTGTYGAFNKVGTFASGPEISGTVTAAQALVASTAAGSFTVHVQVDGVGASDVTVSIGSSDNVNKVVDDINAAIFADGTAKGHLSAASLGGTLQITNADVNTHVTIVANATSAKLGVTADSTTALVSDSKNLINNATSSIAQGQTLDLTVNGAATHITFGTNAGQVHDLAGLRSAIGQVAGLDAGSDVVNGLVKLNVGAKSTATSLSIAGSTNALGVLGLSAGATPGVQGLDSTRQSLAGQFNDLLKQVD